MKRDKLIDNYMPTHSGWFFHPENMVRLHGVEKDGKVHIQESLDMDTYRQLMFSTSGDDARVYYLDIIANEGGLLPEIITDLNASNARSLKLPPNTYMIFKTAHPYNPDRLYKLQVRARVENGGTLYSGLIGLRDEAYLQSDGTLGVDAFYPLVHDASHQPGSVYKTDVGYVLGVGTSGLAVEAARDPDYPLKLYSGTTDVAMVLKTGASGVCYVDSIELMQMDNDITEIPGGKDVVIGTKKISITALPPVINRDARGETETNDVIIEAYTRGIEEYPEWTVEGGDWEYIGVGEDEYDPMAIVIDGDSVEEQVTVQATADGFMDILMIPVVIVGDKNPVYMGAFTDEDGIPETMQGKTLVVGDHFLWIGSYIGDNPEHDPNREEATEEEIEAARDINAALSAEGEFIPGRMYAWNGVYWIESRDSEHLGHAYVDALKIAKDSSLWIYAAVVVAQLGLFQDLLVGNTLKSINYEENESGEPTKGFLLDGPNDIIKAYAMEAYNSKFFGTVESTGFKTITGSEAKIIAKKNVEKDLYKYSDMFDLVADSENFTMKGGMVEGFTFDRLTRRSNSRVLLTSHGYEYEEISAGEHHFFTKLNPTRLFGNTIYYVVSGFYTGKLGYRWLTWHKASSYGKITDFAQGAYSGEGSYTMPSDFIGMAVFHYSRAWWGSQGSYVNYLKLYTSQTFSGLVLRNGDTTFRAVEPKPNAYYPKTKTFSIGADNQDSLARHYVSGTDFYNLFSALPPTVDGFLNSGKIKVQHIGGNLNEYAVSRLVKDANGIDFYTGSGIVRVNKFNEGTATGVYDHLEISEAIAFQSVPDGVEVKSVLPWGALAGNTENVAIGTIESRFEAAYLKYLDILNNLDVGGNITTLGKLIGATINTGDGNYKIGQNLRTTDSPTFAAITAGTVNTGYGANEVYRMTYESVSMVANNAQAITLSSMPYVGEVKFVYVHVSFKNYEKRLYLPSGGTYFVTGLARNDDSYSWNTILESRSSPYHGPNAGIFGGGTSLFYQESDDTVYVLYIIRRVA